MSATEQNNQGQNSQGFEGRDQNHQPDGAPRGRKPRQGKPSAKSGERSADTRKRHDHASHDEPREQGREDRGRRRESFSHRGRRPVGEAFGREEQRNHGERGPRSSRNERGFAREDRRDHRDEALGFERARDAREGDEHTRSFEARLDKRERFARDRKDFSRSAEGDGGKRDRFARDRHDKPARGDWHGRNERDERADERRGSRDGRTSLQPRARFSERFPARPGERRESYGNHGEKRSFGEKAGQKAGRGRGEDARGSRPRHHQDKFQGERDFRRENREGARDDRWQNQKERDFAPTLPREGNESRRDTRKIRHDAGQDRQDKFGKGFGREQDERPNRPERPGHSDRVYRAQPTDRPNRPERAEKRGEKRDGYVSGRDTSVQTTDAGSAYALARTPEDFVRPGEWGYEAEDRSRKAMLKERSGLTDVIILGAGAAGLMCAAHLVDLGLSVCVLDRSRTPARKLALAGGGHANFSNRNISPSHYVCGQEGFVVPVLEKMGTDSMVRTMELLGQGYEEREKGKLFLTGTGADLARALLARCRKGDFTLLLGEHLREDCVRPEAERIMVRSQGARLAARHVVLALGSPACPASGATGLGYAMAQHLGHSVITPRAALTPLTLPETSPWLALSGVSLPVKLTVCDKTISDDMLFTRTGLSGPAILKASLYWKEGEALEIDLLPHELQGLFGDENGKRTPRSVLSRLMPQRLADLVLPESLANRRCAELSREMREELEERVHALKILPSSRAGLRQAEVCMGGVDCAEIEPVTFASKLENRVSIIGEMLDVTGHLGGYNLHWAFASALLCADAVANSLYRLRRG